MLELMIVLGIPLVVGFAAGYGVRAYISYRHRRFAQRRSRNSQDGPLVFRDVA